MNIYAHALNWVYEQEALSRFNLLYGSRNGELPRQMARFGQLIKNHELAFNSKAPLSLLSAPGRTEIIGNHTDHNNGKVIAAAVTLDTIAAVTPREDMEVHVHSQGFPEICVDLNSLTVHPDEKGSSAALVRGVASGMAELGYRIGGFDAVMTTDVLSGSGLSSSAAYEVLICAILDRLYNGMSIPPVEKAKIAQYAENNFFGKPCGLMDQMASSVGGLIRIDFKNEPVFEKMNFRFSEKGYDLVVINTGGSHDNLTDAYASIRKEMNDVAAFFGEAVLRKVRPEQLSRQMNKVRASCGDRAVLRAMHYFEENERVEKLFRSLEEQNMSETLRILLASGLSSWTLLQNIYMPGVSQPVSLALAMAQSFLKKDGVCRVHGGGFAGTTLNVVPQNKTDAFVQHMESVFGTGSAFVLDVRPVGAEAISPTFA